jgi:peptidoglycan hydrolase-like protein with peptidoglycan-binding domain
MAMKQGDSGESVKRLQELLNRNGYSLNTDGIYGAKTAAAIKDYQQRYGLSVTGAYDNETIHSFAQSHPSTPGYSNTPAQDALRQYNTVWNIPPDVLEAANRERAEQNPFQTYIQSLNIGRGGSSGSAGGGGGYSAGGGAAGIDALLAGYGTPRPTYTQSADVASAYAKLQSLENSRPAAYQSKYGDKIQALLDQILNREDFKYDFNADPLFQQYKDRYTQQGKLAMMDTMGAASALTGGYGSSYAQTAGQQTYQNYLQGVNDIIPELQQAAYNKYQDETNGMRLDLDTLQGIEADEYGKYRDTVADWRNDLNYYYTKYNDMSAADYNRYLHDSDAWESDRDMWYKTQMAAQDQSNWEREFAASQMAAMGGSGGYSGGGYDGYGGGSGGSGGSGGGGKNGSDEKTQAVNDIMSMLGGYSSHSGGGTRYITPEDSKNNPTQIDRSIMGVADADLLAQNYKKAGVISQSDYDEIRKSLYRISGKTDRL